MGYRKTEWPRPKTKDPGDINSGYVDYYEEGREQMFSNATPRHRINEHVLHGNSLTNRSPKYVVKRRYMWKASLLIFAGCTPYFGFCYIHSLLFMLFSLALHYGSQA